jgi:hypothetical protein
MMPETSNVTPIDFHHRVHVTVAQCHPREQRLILRDAANLASTTRRRVFALGVRRQGARRVFCYNPACRHPDEVPSVLPWELEIEYAANGVRLPRSVPYYAYGTDLACGLAVAWSPSIWFPEWWT